MNRHAARVQVVQALYLQRSANLSRQEALDGFLELMDGIDSWGEQLFQGVNDSLQEIDSAIQEASRNWRLERMAWVDLSILRLGAYELRVGTVPAVVIDEAVRLAQLLGDHSSPAFVNGILDSLSRSR